MKYLLMTLLLMTSLSTFANEYESSFEEGFNVGKSTCEDEVWTCSLTGEVLKSGDLLVETTFNVESKTRAAGIRKMITECYKYNNVVQSRCHKLIREKKTVCTKL